MSETETWQDHIATCPQCQAAASAREACAEGRALAEAAVVAAHIAYYQGQGKPVPEALKRA